MFKNATLFKLHFTDHIIFATSATQTINKNVIGNIYVDKKKCVLLLPEEESPSPYSECDL